MWQHRLVTHQAGAVFYNQRGKAEQRIKEADIHLGMSAYGKIHHAPAFIRSLGE